MKTILPVVVAILFLSHSIYAQVQGNLKSNNYQQNRRLNLQQNAIYTNDDLTLNINVMMNVEAISYLAVINVVQSGESLEQVNQLMQARIDKVKAGLNLSEEDFYVDFISFLPVYEWEEEKKVFSKKTYVEVPKGFEIQKNLHIRYTDPNQLEDIINICVQNEIYDIITVDYYIENQDQIVDSLRDVSLRLLSERLKEYKEIGLDLKAKKSVVAENNRAYFPTDRYETYTSGSTNTLQKYKARPNIKQASKTVSSFYNPLSYDGFDAVINPEIVEPLVQYTFNLKVKYFLNEEKPKKQYYIVTDNGYLRELQLEEGN